MATSGAKREPGRDSKAAEKVSVSCKRLERKRFDKAVTKLKQASRSASPEDAVIDQVVEILEALPAVSGHAWPIAAAIRSAAAFDRTVNTLSGDPTDVIVDLSREAIVLAGARRRVFDETMYEVHAVARLLGSRSVNPSQFVNARRRRGELIGLLHANRYLFPAFQLDEERGEVRPLVREVNRLLDAASDPWGAASWWFSPNSRLRGGRPADLIDSKSDDVLLAAQSLGARVG